MNNNKPTKTEKTKRAYLNRARKLIMRFMNQHALVGRFSMNKFYTWFISQKPLWARNTWRQYKASMVHACEVWGYAKLGEMIKETRNDGCKDSNHRIPLKERKTSGKKKKSISDKDLSMIGKALRKKPHLAYWERAGLDLFFSSYYVGLRPCEFSRSTGCIQSDDSGKKQAYLIVSNAKNTNGRSHGRFRHIPIGGMDVAIRKLIVRTVKMARESRDAHNRVISPEKFVKLASQGFSQFMSEVNHHKQARISLYSARHQFCANMKYAGLSQAQVGALMGHGSDATAGRHYGKRRCGRRSPNVPVPLKAEVAKVRNKAKPFKKNATTKDKSTGAKTTVVVTKTTNKPKKH